MQKRSDEVTTFTSCEKVITGKKKKKLTILKGLYVEPQQNNIEDEENEMGGSMDEKQSSN